MSSVDVQQIIYALERQASSLEQLATTLMNNMDFNAEFPSEDAERLREAIKLLQPKVKSIEWPKNRVLYLRDDMGQGQLRVLFDSDNDVIVAIWPEGAPSVSVEFCTPGAGGGKSPETRKALIALMCAMERDGASDRPLDRSPV